MAPPRDDDDWSDSDDEVGSDVETAVQLGIPDGPIDTPLDLHDVRVSRIGGHPAFLAATTPPPLEYALCGNCALPMQLLVQVWCPREDSTNDRVLYVWGCPSGSCQKKEGSVRVWRALRFNKEYAEKLARREARRKEKEEAAARAAAEEAARKSATKSNPFSMKSTGQTNPFALGSQIFGGASPVPEEPANKEPSPENKHDDDDESSSGDESDDSVDAEAELAARMAGTTLEESNSGWTSTPAYAPIYLSTISEYLPPAKKMKIPAGAVADEPGDDEGKGGKDAGWALEGYENSIEMDHAFERFTKRVGYEGEQCLRYEFGGTPLPYASDAVFNKLFPVPPAPPLPVTKAAFMVTPAQRRTYDPAGVPHCTHCGSRRVFECQLMPNLINVLKAPAAQKEGRKKQSDKERRQEVLKALKGGQAEGRVGMEWGTCLIFTCEKDCALDGKTDGCWREETVFVQWDD